MEGRMDEWKEWMNEGMNECQHTGKENKPTPRLKFKNISFLN